MEIAPIPGIRIVTLASPTRHTSEISANLGVDPTARTSDDAYSASSQTPDRGLEENDENEDESQASEIAAESESALFAGGPAARISFFA